jgi:hypothetical protein
MSDTVSNDRSVHEGAQKPTADKFSLRPLFIALPVALAFCHLTIFASGVGPIASPGDLLILLIGFVAPIVCLIAILIAAFRRQWRRLISIIFAGAVAFGVIYLGGIFGFRIFFYTMRPSYLHEVAQAGNVPKKSWTINSGYGWETDIIYNRESSQIDRLVAETGKTDDHHCTTTRSRIDDHFYVETYRCD